MDLPPEPALEDLVRRYARLAARLGGDVGERPMVLPTPEFFPDPFRGDEPSVGALVGRMQRHAGMSDVPVAARVVPVDGTFGVTSGCSSGGCEAAPAASEDVPRLVDGEEGWTLHVLEPEVRHPVVLTTVVARALGRVFLVETLPDGTAIEAPEELSADLAAIALGLGPLLLQGAHVYSKSCGGPSVAKLTFLDVGEAAVALALFAELGRHPARRVLGELEATQRSALSEAISWARSNPRLLADLASAPGRVARGDFVLEEARPWLLRVLGPRARSKPIRA